MIQLNFGNDFAVYSADQSDFAKGGWKSVWKSRLEPESQLYSD